MANSLLKFQENYLKFTQNKPVISIAGPGGIQSFRISETQSVKTMGPIKYKPKPKPKPKPKKKDC